MFKAIPVGWSRVPLSSLGERVRRRNTTDNTNVLTISAVHGLVNQKTFFNKIVASANLSNYFLLKRGEFAYNKSYSNGYPVGVVRRLDKYDSGVLSPLYICFDMSSDKVDQDYAVHFFDSQWFIYEVNDIAKEGARNHGLLNVGVGDFFDLSFVLPPLPEQQKIATILSSVDDVIEKTRAQIDKLKDLKTGMMQELLTKGIGHTEFKDSPVGFIPINWEVKQIGEMVVKVGSGITPRGGSASYVDVGIPLIRSQNVHSDGLRLDNVSYITKTQHAIMSGSQLKPCDVLLNITGASIGRCYYLPSDFKEGNVNQHVCIIRLKQKILDSVFLTFCLNSESGQRQIMSLQAGGNREGLNFQQVRAIRLPVPPLDEQKKIAEIVSSIEKNICNKLAKLAHMSDTKKALMQDLLTGKVRVKLQKDMLKNVE